ncbi:MAG: hypothetical protein R2712_13135 [Vicinamibacterales bacterium]
MSRTLPRLAAGLVLVAAAAAVALIFPSDLSGSGQIQAPNWLAPYRPQAQRLIEAAQADQFAWERLAELTDTYGARLTGSDNLTRAIAWAADTMKKDGLDRVRTEPVQVARWVRGRESLEITEPPHHEIPLIGLGGSVATPPEGIEAEVLVVGSADELRRRAADARGRIVLFDVPFTDYGQTVMYRTNGARMAAEQGRSPRWCAPSGRWACGPRTPAACSTRSRAPGFLRRRSRWRTPSGSTASSIAAAPSACASGWRPMSRRRSNRPTSSGRSLGREHPEEIVLVGCHFDSWIRAPARPTMRWAALRRGKACA